MYKGTRYLWSLLPPNARCRGPDIHGNSTRLSKEVLGKEVCRHQVDTLFVKVCEELCIRLAKHTRRQENMREQYVYLDLAQDLATQILDVYTDLAQLAVYFASPCGAACTPGASPCICVVVAD